MQHEMDEQDNKLLTFLLLSILANRKRLFPFDNSNLNTLIIRGAIFCFKQQQLPTAPRPRMMFFCGADVSVGGDTATALWNHVEVHSHVVTKFGVVAVGVYY